MTFRERAIRAAILCGIFGSIAILILWLAIWLLTLPAASAEQDRGAWFKSLKQPITGMSCCDVSDCRQTQAEWRGDGWQAVVAGKWREIPANKIVQLPKTLDGEAYVCNGVGADPAIYCFVPPTMGY